MGSSIRKSSPLKIRNLDKPGHYGDGGVLWLQISGSGSKSWVFRYDLAGKRREMGLGSINTVDLALARTRAQACRLLLQDPIDPLAERRRERAAHASSGPRIQAISMAATMSARTAGPA